MILYLIKIVFMRAYLFLFLLFVGFQNNVQAQINNENKVSDFDISIEHSASGIFTLLCNKGCAWTKLSFRDGNPEKVYHISNFGMDEETNNTQFNFSIQYLKKEIILNSIEGTAWTNLAFTLPKGKNTQKIDGYGMK